MWLPPPLTISESGLPCHLHGLHPPNHPTPPRDPQSVTAPINVPDLVRIRAQRHTRERLGTAWSYRHDIYAIKLLRDWHVIDVLTANAQIDSILARVHAQSATRTTPKYPPNHLY